MAISERNAVSARTAAAGDAPSEVHTRRSTLQSVGASGDLGIGTGRGGIPGGFGVHETELESLQVRV